MSIVTLLGNRNASLSSGLKVIIYFAILGTMFLLFDGLLHSLLNRIGLSLDLINEAKYTAKAYISFFLHQSILPGIVIFGSWISWKLLYPAQSWNAFGLTLSGRSAREFLAGFALSFLMALVVFVVEWALGWIKVGRFAWEARSAHQILYSLYIVVFNWMAMAILEEVVVRGGLLSIIREWVNTTVAILITFIFSASIYLLSAGYESINPLALVSIFFASSLFSFAYLYTGKLWMSIGLHFSWYFWVFNIFGLSGMTCSQAILFETEIQGPILFAGLRGSESGPMGGLLCAGILAAGAFLMRYKYLRSFTKNNSQAHV